MIDTFISQHKKDFQGSGPAWLEGLRQEGLQQFQFLGLPNKKQEAWRYTDAKPIFETDYHLGKKYQPQGLEYDDLQCVRFGKLPGIRVSFVNGHFAPSLSHLDNLPKGLEIRSLREVWEKQPEKLESWLGKQTTLNEDPFVALNTAFMEDGAFIQIHSGTIVEAPIEIFYYSLTNGTSTASHPRNLILAEANSQATVVENYAGKKSERIYFTNAVTEIITQPNANLQHYKFQDEYEQAYHLSHLTIKQERDSQFHSYNISLGSQLARHEIRSLLNDEGAECGLKGLYMAHGKQHVDNQTFIDHAHPHCTSQELYKGILGDQSQGVFDGRILVRPHAQKTQSSLTNNNLLLSKEALINTKPLLEIFADDVKCSHGATIGRLDESQIFYLRSRGINESFARNLLTYAFASEIVQDIPMKLFKAHLEEVILNRLHIGELSVRGDQL